MTNLTKDEMIMTSGGNVSATMVSAIYRIVSFIYELGEALGSYIRRSNEDKMCGLQNLFMPRRNPGFFYKKNRNQQFLVDIAKKQ